MDAIAPIQVGIYSMSVDESIQAVNLTKFDMLQRIVTLPFVGKITWVVDSVIVDERDYQPVYQCFVAALFHMYPSSYKKPVPMDKSVSLQNF